MHARGLGTVLSLSRELNLTGGQACARLAQVQCKEGPTFTYDHVYGGAGAAPELLYEQCVRPLVAGLFRGYNACCFAYGQTGSGKTYTMGSSALGPGAARGVIPCVMEDIFERVASASDAHFTVRVGFVEIFNVRTHQWSRFDIAAAL